MMLLACILFAAAGQWRTVGKPGEWANTVAAVMLNDKLYSVERDGSLHVTQPQTGAWTQVGRLSIGKLKWLAASADKLWAITSQGALYSIDPSTAAVVRAPRDWRDTVAASARGGQLFTIENNGRLYATDLGKLEWKPIGEPDFDGTRRLLATDEALFALEKDGTLYRIERQTGKWRTIGNPGEHDGTIALAAMGSLLYSIDRQGVLYETDPAAHKRRPLGGEDFAETVALVAGKQSLFCIEKDGNLYEISVR